MDNPLKSLRDIEGALPKSDVAPNDPINELATQEYDHAKRKEEINRNHKEKFKVSYDPKHRAERLIRHITESFESAKQAKAINCVDNRILEGRRLKKGEYDALEKSKLDGIDVWFPLTESMSRIALAFLRSILVGTTDNPLWDIEANRIPELPDDVIDTASELAALKLQDELVLQGLEFAPGEIEEKIDSLRTALFKAIDDQADLRIRNLKRKLHSNLQIADFNKVLDDFLQDLVCDPNGTIKGPVISSKPVKEWKNGELKWPKRKYQHYETVPADRLFPSADSTDTQNGCFIIHLNKMTRHELTCARKLKGFVSENIELLLKEFDNKCRDWLNPIESEIQDLENRLDNNWKQDEYIDVIEYHGLVSGELLKLANIKTYLGRKIDDLDSYEYEIWVVDNHMIRAVPAVNPSKRPFHSTSMYPICGSFWGNGLPHITKDLQRTANAFYRAAIRDAGYTSGPYFEYDIGLQDQRVGGMPETMHPGLTLKKNSMLSSVKGDILKAHQLRSQSQLYMQLVDQVFLQAEFTSGINRQMLGQSQPGVGTLGESNTLQANAATGLRSILVNVDNEVIIPIIDMAACQIMMTTDDPNLKTDARFVANGAGSLLTKELNKEKLLQLFNTIVPLYQIQPNIIEPDGLAHILRRLMEEYGEDPDKLIMNPDSVKQRKLELQAALANGGGGGSAQQSLGQGGQAGGAAQAPGVLAPGAGVPPTPPIQGVI